MMKGVLVALVGVAAVVAAEPEVVTVELKPIETRRERLFRLGKLDEDYSRRMMQELALKFVPEELKKEAFGVKADGSAPEPMTNVGDSSYTGMIAVGTPPVAFRCILDTGSSNWWFVGSDCGSGGSCGNICRIKFLCSALCPARCCTESSPDMSDPVLDQDPCAGKTQYNPASSSTSKALNTPFQIQYGTGSCSGNLFSDMVGLKNKNGVALSITQTIGDASHLAQFFAGQQLDGICGLGWPSIAVDHVTPYVQNLISAGKISPLFTVWMSTKTGPGGGQITFGGMDTAHCASGTPAWVPLTSRTYWQFKTQGFSVGSYSRSRSDSVISDTGTSLLAGPQEAIEGMARALGAHIDQSIGLYVLPCGQSGQPIKVNIGGNMYSISSANYNIPIGQGTCIFAAQAFNAGAGLQWILGDTFIRNYCNIYDVGNGRIGFLQATQ